MKIITFNPFNNAFNELNYISGEYAILQSNSDFEYFRNMCPKPYKDQILSWYMCEYTIEDEHANFLKIKYPEIVNIKELV